MFCAVCYALRSSKIFFRISARRLYGVNFRRTQICASYECRCVYDSNGNFHLVKVEEEVNMAEKLSEDVLTMIKHYNNPPNKLRSVQEINARYNLTLENYKKICFMSGDVRELSKTSTIILTARISRCNYERD